MQSAAMDVKDMKGRRTNLSLWNHPGDDIYGAIARRRRGLHHRVHDAEL
jgi:ectoine hydroxylase